MKCLKRGIKTGKGIKMKIIKVTEKTHEELKELGKKGETFDDIIQRLIRTNKRD